MSIEKAPIVNIPCEETADCPFGVETPEGLHTPCESCPKTLQRDADHQHYTEGEGRKQIHREELEQFVEWLKENRSINIAPFNSANIEWAFVIPETKLQSLL